MVTIVILVIFSHFGDLANANVVDFLDLGELK